MKNESDVNCRDFFVDEARCKEDLNKAYLEDWNEYQEYVVALDGSKEVEKVQ